MSDSQQNLGAYQTILTYAIWCTGALLFWIVASIIPSVRQNAEVFLWMNVTMLLLIAPSLLLLAGSIEGAFKHRYRTSSACLLTAIVIGEVLNLIPGNPFALGLPYAYVCQGLNFSELGHAKAAEICARRLLHFWDTPQSDPQWRLTALVGLASALQAQGRYADAEALVQRMFKTVEETDRSDDLQAALLTDVCGSLVKMGRTKDALRFGQKAMDLWQNMSQLRKDQIALMAISISQLGIVYEQAGDYQRALELYRKSLAIRIETCGENTLETAISLNNVGYALCQRGQLDDAREKLEKARQILIALNKQDSALWGHVTENLGDLHRAQGKLDEAENELLSSLQLRTKRFKEDLHYSYHDLGKLYRDKHEYDRSAEYFKQALALREDRFKTPAAETMHEFAKLLKEMNKQHEADAMEQRASDLLKAAEAIDDDA